MIKMKRLLLISLMLIIFAGCTSTQPSAPSKPVSPKPEKPLKQGSLDECIQLQIQLLNDTNTKQWDTTIALADRGIFCEPYDAEDILRALIVLHPDDNAYIKRVLKASDQFREVREQSEYEGREAGKEEAEDAIR